jgi:hypothetical protein
VAQKDLEASLINVVTSREPYPVPGRALRNLVASCLLVLYTRGDSKNMFDTLIALLKVPATSKLQRIETNTRCEFISISRMVEIYFCLSERHYIASGN